MLERAGSAKQTVGGGWPFCVPGPQVLLMDTQREERRGKPLSLQRLNSDLNQLWRSCRLLKSWHFTLWITHGIVERIWLSYILFMNWTLWQDRLHGFVKVLCSSPFYLLQHSEAYTYYPLVYHTLPPFLCFDPSTGSCLLLPIPFSNKSLLLLLYSHYYFCASHSSGQESFKNLNYLVARRGAIFLKVVFLFWTKFISYSVWFYEFAKSSQEPPYLLLNDRKRNIYKELKICNN